MFGDWVRDWLWTWFLIPYIYVTRGRRKPGREIAWRTRYSFQILACRGIKTKLVEERIEGLFSVVVQKSSFFSQRWRHHNECNPLDKRSSIINIIHLKKQYNFIHWFTWQLPEGAAAAHERHAGRHRWIGAVCSLALRAVCAVCILRLLLEYRDVNFT